MPPRVLNVRDVGMNPPNSVYIGRPSKWGNPFRMNHVLSREEVIDKYYDYLLNSPSLLDDIHELTDMDLVCWCSPQPCHGEILLLMANTE